MEMETHTSVFIPMGAAHLIGSEPYKKLLGDHNVYLQSITTVLNAGYTIHQQP